MADFKALSSIFESLGISGIKIIFISEHRHEKETKTHPLRINKTMYKSQKIRLMRFWLAWNVICNE